MDNPTFVELFNSQYCEVPNNPHIAESHRENAINEDLSHNTQPITYYCSEVEGNDIKLESVTGREDDTETASPQAHDSTGNKIRSSRHYPRQKYKNLGRQEDINTREVAIQVSAQLKCFSIPQAVFAERVLSRSQGTLSDLLRNPKPWHKLKSGREPFLKMFHWLNQPESQRLALLLSANKNDKAGTSCDNKRAFEDFKSEEESTPEKQPKLQLLKYQRQILRIFSTNCNEHEVMDEETQMCLAKILKLDICTVANYLQSTHQQSTVTPKRYYKDNKLDSTGSMEMNESAPTMENCYLDVESGQLMAAPNMAYPMTVEPQYYMVSSQATGQYMSAAGAYIPAHIGTHWQPQAVLAAAPPHHVMSAASVGGMPVPLHVSLAPMQSTMSSMHNSCMSYSLLGAASDSAAGTAKCESGEEQHYIQSGHSFIPMPQHTTSSAMSSCYEAISPQNSTTYQ